MTTTANKVGYIYKIVCNNPEITDCYVGSCQSFRTRKANHKSICNNENNKKYNMNVYQFIRANGGWANFNMIAIEQVNYTIRHELLLRERFHLERLGATLNKVIPSRTQQESKKTYYEANKNEISHQRKAYRESNKTQINEKQKEYYEANKTQLITCECGKSCTKNNISNHKRTKNHRQYQQIYEFIYS